MAKSELASAIAAAMGFKLSGEGTEGGEIIEKTDVQNDGQNDDGNGAGNDGGDTGVEGQNDTGSGDGTGTNDDSQKDTGKVLPSSNPVDTDFDKLLLERSKGKFKSMDDIEKALAGTQSGSFVNDEVAKLNEFIAEGGSFDDFVRTQRTDYSKKSDLDILREIEHSSDPSLTAEDVELLIEDKYGFKADASEKEKRIAELKIKRDAATARQTLIDNQKKWKVEKPSPEDAQKAAMAWIDSLSKTTDGISKLDVKIDEKDTFSYVIPPELKTKVKESNKDLSKFFQRYLNKDGSENVEKFVKDMIILDNFDAIVQAAAGFSKTKGKETVIKDIKNTSFNPKDKSAGGSAPKSIAEQAAAQFFGR